MFFEKRQVIYASTEMMTPRSGPRPSVIEELRLSEGEIHCKVNKEIG